MYTKGLYPYFICYISKDAYIAGVARYKCTTNHHHQCTRTKGRTSPQKKSDGQKKKGLYYYVSTFCFVLESRTLDTQKYPGTCNNS